MISLKLYLDKRHLKGRGDKPATVKVVVTRKRSTALISSSVAVLPNQWNPKDEKVVNHPNEKRLNLFLSKFLISIQNVVLDMEENGLAAGMNATQVKDYIMKEIKPREEESPKVYFHEWLDKFVATKENQRTKDIYIATMSRVKHYCPEWERLTFEEMDRVWLSGFEKFLSKTSNSLNGRGVHLRNIRAIFNFAISEEAISVYPFKKYKIKTETTRKRSFTSEQLKVLFNAECSAHLREGLDILKLTFMLCGINFFDLIHLKHDNITNGRLEYTRSKTKKLYSIKIEPEAAQIIERNKGEIYLLSLKERFKRHNNALQEINAKIKKVSEVCCSAGLKASECSKVSTYWARHSWATTAAELDIPKETIAAGLGHNIGSPITSIYIDFNMKKVDEANRRIIDYILYNKV